MLEAEVDDLHGLVNLQVLSVPQNNSFAFSCPVYNLYATSIELAWRRVLGQDNTRGVLSLNLPFHSTGLFALIERSRTTRVISARNLFVYPRRQR